MTDKKRPRGQAATKTETMHEELSASVRDVQSRERPILFSGPMVRAILAGTKAQTRRVAGQPSGRSSATVSCRYGTAGDRLWVRETFAYGYGLAETPSPEEIIAPAGTRPAAAVIYRAAGGSLPAGCSWRPSIFMRRSASRLSLSIEAVRLERLQDIRDEDARAEGIDKSSRTPTQDFSVLWDTINAERTGCSWRANPLVYVIQFAVLHPLEEQSAHLAGGMP